jgi:hypothetical protein
MKIKIYLKNGMAFETDIKASSLTGFTPSEKYKWFVSDKLVVNMNEILAIESINESK